MVSLVPRSSLDRRLTHSPPTLSHTPPRSLMARTRQTAKKTTGGSAKRKQIRAVVESEARSVAKEEVGVREPPQILVCYIISLSFQYF
jgi:hypothetical protein